MWMQREIRLDERPRGFHLIGREVEGALPELASVATGLLHLHLLHTSASLALNENASPDVRADLERWFNEAIREDAPYWEHTLEGPDDMPAHVKSVLIGPALSLPVSGGSLALGTWQGIYLCEHRDRGGARRSRPSTASPERDSTRSGRRSTLSAHGRLERGMSQVLRADANEGKVALVTGGGTGIGRATAASLAASGARVVVCGRRPELLDRVREELAAGGAECLAVPCDIREPDQVEDLVGTILDRFGSIDVLVNNAGGQFGAKAEEISLKGWKAVSRLNLDGNWSLTSQVATRAMIPARGGLIVFVGFSPRRGIPAFAHACATRAALENLASGLALEWSRFGIRSVCVSCGPIETDGLASYGPDSFEQSRRTIPLGRLGAPEEVAETIAFLASPGGGFITGTTILVDGGVDAWGLAEPPPEPER